MSQFFKIGVDGRKIPEAAKRGSLGTLDHAVEIGMEGVFFRTVLDMSPTLDPGVLAAIRQRADELGIYLETGLGKVNPYAAPEAPEIRQIGDGDIVAGFRRMMQACRAIGCTELWVGTANYKSQYTGRFAYDRFRTDVDWNDQLRATTRFLTKLAPIARDLDIHINLETHEEITSFELVRIVEEVGADVLGIVFDTANVIQRLEHPVWAAKRIAPYVRQTHMKDAALEIDRDGARYQLRPCGTGMVEFDKILRILQQQSPVRNLTIENEQSYDDRPRPAGSKLIELWDQDFLAAHPDLSVAEFAAFQELARAYEHRVQNGEALSHAAHVARPYGYQQAVEFIQSSAAHLRSCLAAAPHGVAA